MERNKKSNKIKNEKIANLFMVLFAVFMMAAISFAFLLIIFYEYHLFFLLGYALSVILANLMVTFHSKFTNKKISMFLCFFSGFAIVVAPKLGGSGYELSSRKNEKNKIQKDETIWFVVTIACAFIVAIITPLLMLLINTLIMAIICLFMFFTFMLISGFTSLWYFRRIAKENELEKAKKLP